MAKRNGTKARFALCLDNDGYPASLEVGKLYRVISDRQARTHGYLRIVDESGEDYAYAAKRFHLLALPRTIGKTIALASVR